jgi:predicted secreted protein
VVTYHPAQGPVAMITLVDVFQLGFEGPDRRFLAVATRLPQ